jgi:hypothetical protein
LKDSGAQILDAGSVWLLSSFRVAPSMHGFSVWNLVHSIQLAPRILKWFLDFWNICVPLVSVHSCCWNTIHILTHFGHCIYCHLPFPFSYSHYLSTSAIPTYF